MESRRAGPPPDGGYGWVVVMATFFITGLTLGVLKNFGVFFLDIQSHFGVQTSTASWVSSATIATLHLGAPVASALSLHFSQRAVIVGGGLLTASGMLLASLDLGLPWLYLTMGVLQGTGISFAWIPANIMVNHYFVRWRPIAYAVASSGECVFAVVFSPVFQWLTEVYGWQGALLVVGGLQLNLCVCGALMRPMEGTRGPTQDTKDDPEGNAAASLRPKRKAVFQCSLLRKPQFVLYILFAIFAAMGLFIPPLFLVPFASSVGMEKYWPAYVLSVLALADLAGRLVCGWVANLRLLRNLQLLTAVTTLAGVVLLLLPISRDHRAILCLTALYGILFGCVVAVYVIALVDVVALEGFDSALGMLMLFRSIGGFAGPPAAGWLVDETNDYSAAFYLSGLCLLSAAVFVVLVDCLLQRRKATEADGLRAWDT